MMLRLCDFARVEIIDEPLASHRYHATASSQLHRQRHLENRFAILTRWLGWSPQVDAGIQRSRRDIVLRLYSLGAHDVAATMAQDFLASTPDRRVRLVQDLASRGIGADRLEARMAERFLRALGS